MKHSTGEPTRLQLRRWSLLYDLGCCVCGTKPCEIHHFTRNNKRLGHEWTVPLCPEHHTGTEFSWHKTRRAFREKMGNDCELLARVNTLIGWPPGAVVPMYGRSPILDALTDFQALNRSLTSISGKLA